MTASQRCPAPRPSPAGETGSGPPIRLENPDAGNLAPPCRAPSLGLYSRDAPSPSLLRLPGSACGPITTSPNAVVAPRHGPRTAAHRRHVRGGAPPDRADHAQLPPDRGAHRREPRQHLPLVARRRLEAAAVCAARERHGADRARQREAQAPHARGAPRRARRAPYPRAGGERVRRSRQARRGAGAPEDGEARRPPAAEAAAGRARGPEEAARPIVQLCVGGVDLSRAPRAAVDDFLANRERPPKEPCRPRGRGSDARARSAWMMEKER